jgi:hypothetical protein
MFQYTSSASRAEAGFDGSLFAYVLAQCLCIRGCLVSWWLLFNGCRAAQGIF